MNSVKGIFGKASDEWATPVSLFKELDEEFHFTLDPCSTDENALCEKHYTIEDDGLSQSWFGQIVFCNPPYSKCFEWVQKAYMESITNEATVVMLLPSRTDTKWFHQFVLPHAKVIFLRGRLRFNNSNQNAPFPSLLAIFSKLDARWWIHG